MVLVLASSRPYVSRSVAFGRTSIILALDVSRSMCANDLQPSRLSVAQDAAREFVRDQPKGRHLGLVVFSGFAQVAVAPTTDREALLSAIDGLTTGTGGTAIGAAILKSLNAIAEVNPTVRSVGDVTGVEPAGVPPSDFVADVVVLLTDGANTRGVDPVSVVPFAIERGVRVFTIGVGTTHPADMGCTRQQLGASLSDGAFQTGGASGVISGRAGYVADEETLRSIADRTGGRFYDVEDRGQLGDAFAGLAVDVATKKEDRELSHVFAGVGALLAIGTLVASFRWNTFPS